MKYKNINNYKDLHNLSEKDNVVILNVRNPLEIWQGKLIGFEQSGSAVFKALQPSNECYIVSAWCLHDDYVLIQFGQDDVFPTKYVHYMVTQLLENLVETRKRTFQQIL